MARYRITEWEERYEVNEKGRAWKPGEEKRAGPLTYIRSKVHGRSQGLGWRKLIEAAGSRKAPGVFGIFQKLLELSADQKCEDRGFIQDDPDCPVSFVLGLDNRDVQFAISVLLAIGWLGQGDGQSGDSRKLPEIPQVSPQSYHIISDHIRSEQVRSDPPIAPLKRGARQFVPPSLEDVQEYIRANPELNNVDAQTFWKGFSDGGWIDTQGKPVRNWKLKLRTWSSHAPGKPARETPEEIGVRLKQKGLIYDVH